MPNNAFSASNVMTTSIQGLKEAQDRLTAVNAALNPNGLRSTLNLAAGLVHRYLIGLGQDHPPLGQVGVLPVISGRLKNSLFFLVENQGGVPVGRVTTNLAYAGVVNDVRQFMERAAKDTQAAVHELLADYVADVTVNRTYKL